MYKNLIIAQDPNCKGNRIIGIKVESRILIDFISEEGSNLVPLENLTADQLRVLVKSLLLTDLV